MFRWSRLATVSIVSLLAACAQMPCTESTEKSGGGKNPNIATCTDSGQPIRLPRNDSWILRSVYEIEPGVVLPHHYHPYHRLALVLKGNLAVTNVESGKTVNYGPGDLVVEAVNQTHYGVNTGSSQVYLRVLDMVPKGVENNTVLVK